MDNKIELDNKDSTFDENSLVMLTAIRSQDLAREISFILEENGIPNFLRNQFSDVYMGGLIDFGGIRIDVAAKDVERALNVLSDAGISLPNENDTNVGKLTSMIENAKFLGKGNLENKLWRFIIIIGIGIVILAILATLLKNQIV